MRPITKIVVHCTDSPDSMDIGADEIRKWHRERGFDDIGYHFVVRRNGTTETGRAVERAGAHAVGHNRHSIGVVWVGRRSPAPLQRRSLAALLARLLDQYNLADEALVGHRELAPLAGKTCPNLDMNVLRRDTAALRELK